MVKFFDQKQEVIQIELTPYGRQKLSEGKFNPSYYAFYDTGVLYDGAFGGKSETQNQIVERIKNTTPRTRPWTKFSSSSRPISSRTSANYETYFDKYKAYCATYNRFLGRNNQFSDFAPSWDIRVTNNSDKDLNEHPEYMANNTLPVVSASLYVAYSVEQSGSSVRYDLLENQNITLDIQELNTIFSVNGNYDLEVFKLDPKGGSEMQALSFINTHSINAENLRNQTTPAVLAQTIGGNSEDILAGFPVLDDTYVEYYFNILLDQEVPGVEMPSNSTIYKNNIDRNPGNICKVVTNEV
tara:strand:- start:1356 stop:2249 length:894 start_codon:yes stop_codon:yes gene_type:complete